MSRSATMRQYSPHHPSPGALTAYAQDPTTAGQPGRESAHPTADLQSVYELNESAGSRPCKQDAAAAVAHARSVPPQLPSRADVFDAAAIVHVSSTGARPHQLKPDALLVRGDGRAGAAGPEGGVCESSAARLADGRDGGSHEQPRRVMTLHPEALDMERHKAQTRAHWSAPLPVVHCAAPACDAGCSGLEQGASSAVRDASGVASDSSMLDGATAPLNGGTDLAWQPSALSGTSTFTGGASTHRSFRRLGDSNPYTTCLSMSEAFAHFSKPLTIRTTRAMPERCHSDSTVLLSNLDCVPSQPLQQSATPLFEPASKSSQSLIRRSTSLVSVLTLSPLMNRTPLFDPVSPAASPDGRQTFLSVESIAAESGVHHQINDSSATTLTAGSTVMSMQAVSDYLSTTVPGNSSGEHAIARLKKAPAARVIGVAAVPNPADHMPSDSAFSHSPKSETDSQKSDSAATSPTSAGGEQAKLATAPSMLSLVSTDSQIHSACQSSPVADEGLAESVATPATSVMRRDFSEHSPFSSAARSPNPSVSTPPRSARPQAFPVPGSDPTSGPQSPSLSQLSSMLESIGSKVDVCTPVARGGDRAQSYNPFAVVRDGASPRPASSSSPPRSPPTGDELRGDGQGSPPVAEQPKAAAPAATTPSAAAKAALMHPSGGRSISDFYNLVTDTSRTAAFATSSFNAASSFSETTNAPSVAAAAHAQSPPDVAPAPSGSSSQISLLPAMAPPHGWQSVLRGDAAAAGVGRTVSASGVALTEHDRALRSPGSLPRSQDGGLHSRGSLPRVSGGPEAYQGLSDKLPKLMWAHAHEAAALQVPRTGVAALDVRGQQGSFPMPCVVAAPYHKDVRSAGNSFQGSTGGLDGDKSAHGASEGSHDRKRKSDSKRAARENAQPGQHPHKSAKRSHDPTKVHSGRSRAHDVATPQERSSRSLMACPPSEQAVPCHTGAASKDADPECKPRAVTPPSGRGKDWVVPRHAVAMPLPVDARGHVAIDMGSSSLGTPPVEGGWRRVMFVRLFRARWELLLGTSLIAIAVIVALLVT